jgi:drug/metabolite transporter (DMT)-like permease
MRRLLGEESQVDEKRPSIRGSLWMIVAGVLFASMGVFVKLGLKYFSSSELVFYRSLFGVVLIFLVVRVNGLAVYSPNWTLHISRSLAGFAGMMLLFYVIGILPLSTATTLNYTSPLFLVVLSALVLRERLKPGLVLAVVLGFAGVVLLLRPTFSANQTVAGLLGLASGFFAGVAYLTTKHLGRLGEPGWRVVFYFTLVSTIGSGAFALAGGFHEIGLEGLLVLLGVGVCATLGQLAMTRAYHEGDTLTVGSLAYSTVIFTTLFSLFIWQDALPIGSWFAMGLIIVSGILAVRSGSSRDLRLHRQA